MSDFQPLEFHAYANLFPLIEGDEFAALVEDIRENGLRELIVLMDGQILDGRNRYRALLRLIETGELLGPGWDFNACEPLTRLLMEEDVNLLFINFGSGDGDPLAYVLSKNLNRRHLNESQRAMVAAELETLRHGGDRRGEDVQDANLHLEILPQEKAAPKPQIDREGAAKALHISPRSVANAAKVRDRGAPELQHAVKSGEVSVSAAADLAGLPHDDQREIVARGESEILKAAKEINAEKRERRRAERFANIAEIARANAPLPAGQQYPVIYADPPWRFDSGFGDRSIENHYPTMSVDEICALPVGALAAKDCALFMWVTVPHLESAFAVLRAWGFAYKSHAMWDKDEAGTGYWFFNQHEILIIATRGDFPAPDPVIKARSVYREAKGKHSAKPDYYYGLIERMTPGLPRIEMFARAPHLGWDAWGNQAAQESCERAESSRASATDESNGSGITTSRDGEDRQNRTSPEHFPEVSVTAAASTGGGVAPASQDTVADDGLGIPEFLRRASSPEQAEAAP